MKKFLIATAALSLLAAPAFAQTAQPLTQDQPVNNGGDATTATGSATNNSDLGTATTNYGGSASSATGGLNEGETTTVGGQGTGAGMNNAANTTGNNADMNATGSVDANGMPIVKKNGSASNTTDLGSKSTNYGSDANAATGGLEEGPTTSVGGAGTGAGTNQ